MQSNLQISPDRHNLGIVQPDDSNRCALYRLNTDILLEIIDYLPYDSLLEISLACKRLWEVCRPPLFRNVVLHVRRIDRVQEALAMRQADIWKYTNHLVFTGEWQNLCSVVPHNAIATFVADMPNLHRVIIEGDELPSRVEVSIPWPYLRAILSSASRLRYLDILVAVELNGDATAISELDFPLPCLTSLTLTIPDYKRHPRHDTTRVKLLSALLPRLSSMLTQLFVSLDVAPLQLIATSQWPCLRELTLQGDRRASLDPHLVSIALAAGMPELRSFSILRARRKTRRRLILWPADWTGGIPFPKLECLEVSYPNPKDDLYSHLPDTLRRLSLRCWPRHYMHQQRCDRNAMNRLRWQSPVLTASEMLSILQRCRSVPLEQLEIEYRVDENDEVLLRSLAELFPALRTLTVYRYRAEGSSDDIPVSIAQALSHLHHLQVLRAHLDFPHAPHTLSPFQTYPRRFAELDAFQDFLSQPADTLARRLSPSLRFVCLLHRIIYDNEWLPFRIVRDACHAADADDSHPTFKEVRLEDTALTVEGLQMMDDPSPYTPDTIPPGPDFIDDFEF
ncbi:hypothetical protein PYCCODRAFT_49822 [Trametes coccinea BRFM310]|uniref:F-box domain-containing protein n=1 Tax=Trametes coccinea (strain BRFM310) TaxID=1353009 RepID=A0A1Y2J5Q9_TRAC3|nr:hypothetical protein PYCCODRAFT_49822 [Trametes coccinea BRFM310]